MEPDSLDSQSAGSPSTCDRRVAGTAHLPTHSTSSCTCGVHTISLSNRNIYVKIKTTTIFFRPFRPIVSSLGGWRQRQQSGVPIGLEAATLTQRFQPKAERKKKTLNCWYFINDQFRKKTSRFSASFLRLCLPTSQDACPRSHDTPGN